MNTRRRFPTRAADLAPWLALALLVVMAFGHVGPLGTREARPDRANEIARAFAMAPYEIGDWLGADISDMTDEARESGLLPHVRAQRVLARRYTNSSDGRAVDLVVVHCADAKRDAIDLDPSRLYPSNGWVREREPSMTTDVRAGRGAFEMQVETYRLLERLGGLQSVRVYSAFLGSEPGSSDAPRGRIEARSHADIEIEAHVRLAVSGEWDPDDSLRAVSEIVDGVEPLLRTLNGQ